MTFTCIQQGNLVNKINARHQCPYTHAYFDNEKKQQPNTFEWKW